MSQAQRPRICRTRRQRGVSLALLAGALLASLPALADDPMLLHDDGTLRVRAHLQLGLNAVAEQNLFWNYARKVAPTAKFDADTQWLEAYAKPGISFNRSIGDTLQAYGKLSAVASGTLGSDAYATGDTGRITLEEAYLGLRKDDDSGATFDLSVGPREFKAGTGMLLANGASSGFERGALKLGPRKAWEFAALGKIGFGGASATGFFLNANELPSSESGTRIVGTDIRYDSASKHYLGLTYGHVVQSSAPYPKAAPGGIGAPSILPGARDGLNFANLYGRIHPFDGALERFFIAGDLAREWNSRIDMQAWAGRIQLGYTFTDVLWSPSLSYTYQSFSGDNPSTTRLERFDPLYFEGSPSAWSTGSKSSMVFINTNVNSHQLSLRVQPTQQDTVTLRYAYIQANHLLSPLQFGQATRLDLASGIGEPIAGVTRKHLADDVFLEYTRQLAAGAYLTAGFSASFPGPGANSIAQARAPIWTGGFVNVVLDF